jgi:hypothetical protein
MSSTLEGSMLSFRQIAGSEACVVQARDGLVGLLAQPNESVRNVLSDLRWISICLVVCCFWKICPEGLGLFLFSEDAAWAAALWSWFLFFGWEDEDDGVDLLFGVGHAQTITHALRFPRKK